jgi:hypothetical protein
MQTQHTARALSIRRLLRDGAPHECKLVFGLWLLSLAASIALGLATVVLHWSGLPVRLGGIELYVTVYPPLVICMLWTLTCGWWWGAVPGYLATLMLALYSGMPPGWALLFSAANPLGFAVVALGYRAIPISRHLHNPGSVLFYLQLAFVGAIFSSSGALVWCYTNRIGSTALLPIWQGWWLGAFLQSVVIVAPLLAVLWPHIERWQSRGGICWSSRAPIRAARCCGCWAACPVACCCTAMPRCSWPTACCWRSRPASRRGWRR